MTPTKHIRIKGQLYRLAKGPHDQLTNLSDAIERVAESVQDVATKVGEQNLEGGWDGTAREMAVEALRAEISRLTELTNQLAATPDQLVNWYGS